MRHQFHHIDLRFKSRLRHHQPPARVADPLDEARNVALRVYPSSHTNPVWVTVGDKPVRASRASAEWCLKGVDQCWSKKEPLIRPEERDAARAAYDVARKAYGAIIEESDAP